MFNKFSRFEEQFVQWRGEGYPGFKPETYKYVDFLSDPADDQAAFVAGFNERLWR